MGINELIQVVEDGIKNLPFPNFTLPPWLLYCVSKRRTGISVGRALSNIYAWMQSAGIPTGVNPDGSPNLIGGMAGAITQAIMDEICENGKITVACGPGDILIQGDGGNSGGPVHIVGANTGFANLGGIFQ